MKASCFLLADINPKRKPLSRCFIVLSILMPILLSGCFMGNSVTPTVGEWRNIFGTDFTVSGSNSVTVTVTDFVYGGTIYGYSDAVGTGSIFNNSFSVNCVASNGETVAVQGVFNSENDCTLTETVSMAYNYFDSTDVDAIYDAQPITQLDGGTSSANAVNIPNLGHWYTSTLMPPAVTMTYQISVTPGSYFSLYFDSPDGNESVWFEGATGVSYGFGYAEDDPIVFSASGNTLVIHFDQTGSYHRESKFSFYLQGD